MPSSLRILVADDDPAIRRAVKKWLEERELSVVQCEHPEKLFERVSSLKPNLVLLDVMFGEADGIELCSRLRREDRTRSVPVILMSGARTRELDQVEGLQEGADDYLIKPLTPELLSAKIDAVLRRAEASEELKPVLSAYELELDVEGRTVSISGKDISLTRKEFDLLTQLLRKRGRIVSPQFLLESVWGYRLEDYNDTHTVEVHLSRLKKKLGSDFSKKITTVVGSGYKLI